MADITTQNSDSEYQALKIIEDLQESRGREDSMPSQRDFAKALNMSVGMTNAIIKRLVNKGWLVINKINGRNLSYALTPEGTREVAKRSYRYLRRTIGNVVRWKEAVDAAVLSAREKGCNRVLLIGDSDLDFIIEHAATRHGMVFVRSYDIDAADRKLSRGITVSFYSERIFPDENTGENSPSLIFEGAIYLSELLNAGGGELVSGS